MEGFIFSTVRLTITLSESEQFQFETETGPIMVSQIRFGNGLDADRVSVRGWGISSKDGRKLTIQRNGTMPLSDLPREVLEEAIKTLRGNA